MRLRPLKTKELGSVNTNDKNVSFSSLFLSSPHDKLPCVQHVWGTPAGISGAQRSPVESPYSLIA